MGAPLPWMWYRLEMAAWDRPSPRLHQEAEPAVEGDPHLPTGRELSEANRFAYAALCGISLSQLFPEPEHRVCDGPGQVAGVVRSRPADHDCFCQRPGRRRSRHVCSDFNEDPILKDDPLVITQDLLSFSLKDGRYDARARVLICHVTSLLHLPLGELDLLEETFLESLKETKEEESEMAEASRKKKENRRKWKRYLLIGLATVGGGTVIAATIIGSAGAAALGSVAGIAVMTSLFGAAGASLTGYKMKKRVGAIEEFTFLPLTEGRQLHITIAITGWLASGKYRTFSAPWAALARSCEQYCLAWEAKYLMELGNALETILSGLANIVAQEALKYTVLSGITAALTWPASLLSVANIIDNPWGVCLHRSAEVGKHLARVLLSRQQGRRPVTLIGFSLGARVIYFCLHEMAQEKVLASPGGMGETLGPSSMIHPCSFYLLLKWTGDQSCFLGCTSKVDEPSSASSVEGPSPGCEPCAGLTTFSVPFWRTLRPPVALGSLLSTWFCPQQ
ncbi:hypothetical protein QTO34_018993 [Cnephaeus nilssonii]|uniref:Transmembrane and coiled-coil domain-containing protein 4 n=1 Tax=Cnephaeus nilssonii TaxID=3371016 RepID=A0AA40LQM0_CNENI|nr:hypothetical protein QTO34_018993 [Eptesicus nilssonii]